MILNGVAKKNVAMDLVFEQRPNDVTNLKGFPNDGCDALYPHG
jgi:hypothetical protein